MNLVTLVVPEANGNKEGRNKSEMIRFDFSPMSQPSCRSMPLQHEYEAIKYPSMLAVRPCRSMDLEEEEHKELKQLNFDAMKDVSDDVEKVKGTNPSSPARTASTQFSSNCSMSMESSRDSIDPQCIRSSSYPTDAIELQFPPGKEEVKEVEPLSNMSDDGSKGIKRSNSFSKILKRLRNNISLVTSASFDSGLSKLSKRRLDKKRKSTFSAADVDVRVVEGEGVEIITKYSNESTASSNSYADSDEFSVPKVIRDTSTFAAESLASREGSYEDDIEIRRLCNLMNKIINSEDEEDVKLEDPNSGLVRLEENVRRHLREEESELGVEVLSISSVSASTESDGFSDVMMFVNNEQRVLEYAPEEFQRLKLNGI